MSTAGTAFRRNLSRLKIASFVKVADLHFGNFGQEPGQHFRNDDFSDSFPSHQPGGFAHEISPGDRFSIGDVKCFILAQRLVAAAIMPRTKSLTYMTEYRRSFRPSTGKIPLLRIRKIAEHIHVARAENDRCPDNDVRGRAKFLRKIFSWASLLLPYNETGFSGMSSFKQRVLPIGAGRGQR